MTRKTWSRSLYPGYESGLRTPVQCWFSLELACCSNSVSHSNQLYFPLILSHVCKFFSNLRLDHDITLRQRSPRKETVPRRGEVKRIALFLMMEISNRHSGNSRETHSGEVSLTFLSHPWILLRSLSVRITCRKETAKICKQNGKRTSSIHKVKTEMLCFRSISCIKFNNSIQSRLPNIIEIKRPHPNWTRGTQSVILQALAREVHVCVLPP